MKPIDRKFEKFLAGQNKPSQEMLYVSINRSGRINLNANCYRRLGKPPAAYLFYNRADDVIAVEPLQSPRMPAAFTLKASHKSGWRIDAAPFCRHHNIRLDSTQRFIAPEIDDGRLYLKLQETVTVCRPMPKRKRSPE